MLLLFLIRLVRLVSQVLIFLVIVYVLTTYFLAPYHPIRHRLARLVEPMLAPIRRWVPPLAGIDISPILLILIIQLITRLLEGFLWTLYGSL